MEPDDEYEAMIAAKQANEELIPWLRAQVYQDERTALECPSRDWELGIVYGSVIATTGGRIALEAPHQRIADHIARHDPARALAEVAVKRALIDEVEIELADDWTVGAHRARLIATVYADRPGYREDWAVDPG